jgi:hypothetical protein
MNYALALSLKAERHLAALQGSRDSTSANGGHSMPVDRDGTSESANAEGDLEERALALAVEEVSASSGGRFRPWAANGKAIRIGQIVLLVDSDSNVPEVILLLMVMAKAVVI